MGDFNEVRFASERYGSSFHALNAANFNSFFANSNLIDIPLGGYSYTWADKYASQSCSKNLMLIMAPRHSGYFTRGFPKMISIMLLKTHGKMMSIVKKRSKESNRKSLQETIIQIDQRIDNGITLPDDLANRSTAIRELHSIDKQSDMDAAQRAKVTWAIEGDENTKYFHGIVNKKRRHLAIKGILVDGDWIDDPARVKSEFFKHFANQFSDPGWSRAPFDGQFSNLLDPIQSNDLESDISNEEIKKAVWDCGSDKSPGPDGFTFDFFKKFWYIVGGEVINAVKEFFNSSKFPNGCNSSFITLIPKVLDAKNLNDFRPISLIGCQYKIIGKILANRLSHVINNIISTEQSAFIKGRQIMDGPLILNETISWCKYRKEKALMFKVDFQKAFDSVRWDHLDDILDKIGFGLKWRGWIRGCLTSSKASVLVNGSPTDEFLFHRGLRQGDPLSPFLFILVMESLHVSFQKIIDRVGVPLADIKELADTYGCLANNLPLTYLGVKVQFIWLPNVIQAIHGTNGSLDNSFRSSSHGSAWIGILKAVANLKSKDKFPRLFQLETQKDILVANKLQCPDLAVSFRRSPRSGIEDHQFSELSHSTSSVILSLSCDRCSWSLNGMGIFSVKSARGCMIFSCAPFIPSYIELVQNSSDKGPLEATSLPSSMGKAVYISPLLLLDERRD
ncbi:RNA-directed DNA polymerase, eukaryota [Tanacetum coccineum]